MIYSPTTIIIPLIHTAPLNRLYLCSTSNSLPYGHISGTITRNAVFYVSPSSFSSLCLPSLQLSPMRVGLSRGSLLSLIYRRISNQETARDRWKLYQLTLSDREEGTSWLIVHAKQPLRGWCSRLLSSTCSGIRSIDRSMCLFILPFKF